MEPLVEGGEIIEGIGERILGPRGARGRAPTR